MYSHLAILLLTFASGLAAAGPVKPVIPCGSQVYAFGGSTILAEGVKVPGSNDFVSRMDTFFERVCRGDVEFKPIAKGSGRLVDDVALISETLARSPRSVAFVHFPSRDLEAGVSIETLLQAYRRVLHACAAGGSICIIGGQQPVNTLAQEITDRQLELERRASAAFGSNYLPIYRYFQSESNVRRLMIDLDSGDGRFINDFGHDLLYKLYRRRLIELTAAAR